MIRPSQRWLILSAVASAFLAACGEPPSKPDPGDNPPVDSGSALVLTRVGSGAVDANPGDVITLRALLSQSEVGPVMNAPVEWRIAENPGGAELEVRSSTTDENGVAQNVLTIGDQGTITIRATSEGATSKAIWKIEVQPVQKRLKIVPSVDTVVTDNPLSTKANVNALVNSPTQLRVRVTVVKKNGEIALVDEPVTFSFVRSIAGAEFGTPTGIVRSTGSGDAAMVLSPGSTVGEYPVIASIAGGITATFTVSVKADIPGDQCRSSAQCPASSLCIDGVCQAAGGGGSCAGNDRPCPIGYACLAGQCQPADVGDCSACPNGYYCDTGTSQCVPDNPECSDDNDCPSGFFCRAGTCTPSSGAAMDVSGHWFTRHHFDIREALPSWLQFSASAIRTIDQILLGQLNLPSWVNAIIRGLVQQYVPQWVVTLVYVLDNIFTVMSDLRAEGDMHLVANGGPNLLAGTEDWTSFVFYLLAQCGQNIGGNPSRPPPCARMDIYTSELEQVDLSVQVRPFTATLGGANGQFTLKFDTREARMKLAGILKYVLDTVIQTTTGYPSLEDRPCTPQRQWDCGPGSGALSNLIDCEGISQLVEDIIPIPVTGLCQIAVQAAGQAIADQLRRAVISNDTLEFQGSATARPGPYAPPNYAEELGYADFETRSSPDGEWRARFKIPVMPSVKDVPGRWRASRVPFGYQ